MSGGNLGNAFDLILKLHSREATIERPGSSEIVNGIIPSTSTTLTSDISEGLAYVDGKRIVIPTTTNTYNALKDTYLEINSTGVLVYVEVDNGATVPNNTNFRIAKIVTDATSIISVSMLKTPKSIYGIAPVKIRYAPSNYSRNMGSVEETVTIGREFVISKKCLDLVNFPVIKRGDRIKDPEIGTSTVSEVKEMFGLGGAILGYRVRAS